MENKIATWLAGPDVSELPDEALLRIRKALLRERPMSTSRSHKGIQSIAAYELAQPLVDASLADRMRHADVAELRKLVRANAAKIEPLCYLWPWWRSYAPNALGRASSRSRN